eukprot:10075911-Heterocapsa_arctica.AAC.1
MAASGAVCTIIQPLEVLLVVNADHDVLVHTIVDDLPRGAPHLLVLDLALLILVTTALFFCT